MSLLRRIRTVLIAMSVVAMVSAARADEASDLEKGTTLYNAGRYEEGAERFRQMLDPHSPRALKEASFVERARAYFAACLVALGRNDEATHEVETIYRANPLYAPDTAAFPGKVLDLFTDARERMRTEIEAAARALADKEKANRARAEKAKADQAAYLAKLQELAADESVVVRHSRWIAALPFGVGQFQNGQEGWGYTFLVSQVVAAGTSIATGAVLMSLAAEGTKPRIDRQDLEARLNTLQPINTIANAAFAALALGGILHAQLTFVPETREHRVRPIPPPPSVQPGVAVGASGVSFTLSGRF